MRPHTIHIQPLGQKATHLEQAKTVVVPYRSGEAFLSGKVSRIYHFS